MKMGSEWGWLDLVAGWAAESECAPCKDRREGRGLGNGGSVDIVLLILVRKPADVLRQLRARVRQSGSNGGGGVREGDAEGARGKVVVRIRP